MAIDWMKQHTKQAGIAILALAACGFAVYSVSKNARSGSRPVSEGMAYFSTDDGRTWFEASVTNPSPFDKEGKQAYRVFVWRQGSGEPFVSHLMRSGPTAQPMLNSDQAPSAANRRIQPPMSMSGVEVKRPGEKAWVRADSREGEAISTLKGPDGTANALEAIEP